MKARVRIAKAEREVMMDAQKPAEPELCLLYSVRARFSGLGDVVLDLPKRSGAWAK